MRKYLTQGARDEEVRGPTPPALGQIRFACASPLDGAERPGTSEFVLAANQKHGLVSDLLQELQDALLRLVSLGKHCRRCLRDDLRASKLRCLDRVVGIFDAAT